MSTGFRSVSVMDDDLTIVTAEELEDAEKIDDLLTRVEYPTLIERLSPDEREFLIVRGIDPDTGRDLD